MATGVYGNLYDWASQYIRVAVEYTEAYSVANNTSDVTVALWYMRTNNYSGTTQATGEYQVLINGSWYVVYNGTYTLPNDQSWHKVGEKTVKGIAHDADGTKSISVGGWFQNTGAGVSVMDCDVRGTIALTTIPRASKPTVTPGTITLDGSSAVVIKTNRASTSFTHTIKLKLGSWSKTITNVGSQTTWTPSVSEFTPLMTTSPQTVTVECTTYNGSAKVGDTQSTTFKVQIDTSTEYAEVTDVTLTDTNSATAAVETTGKFIKGASYLKADITFKAVGSSTTLASAKVTYSGSTYNFELTGLMAATTFETTNVQDCYMVIAVTDNHGNTRTKQVEVPLINYEPVHIKSVNVQRVNDNGLPSDVGTRIGYSVTVTGFAGSFGNQSNTFTLRYLYRKAEPEGQSYINGNEIVEHQVTDTGSVVTYTFEGNTAFLDVFLDSEQYDLRFSVSDMFSTSASAPVRIHEGLPVYGWGRDHFDVYGLFHIHSRKDPDVYQVFGFNPNDAKSGVTLSAYGYITSGGGKAVIYVPMHELPVAELDKNSFSSFVCAMRTTAGGYLGGTSGPVDLQSQIESVSITVEQSVMRVVLAKSGGYGLTNNTPLVGEVTLSYTTV